MAKKAKATPNKASADKPKSRATAAPKGEAKKSAPKKSAPRKTAPVRTPTALSARPSADPAPLPLESATATEPAALEQRYASLEEAKSATLDSLLDQIEEAESRLIHVKRATSFAELEPLANGRADEPRATS